MGVSVDTGCANNSEHSRRQLCSIILGSRKMTTFKKLPTISPSKVQVIVKKKGSCKASIVELFSLCSTPSNHRAQHKDRQVHGDHQSTYQNPQHRHDDGFNQRAQAVHGVVNCRLIVICYFAQHIIQCP